MVYSQHGGKGGPKEVCEGAEGVLNLVAVLMEPRQKSRYWRQALRTSRWRNEALSDPRRHSGQNQADTESVEMLIMPIASPAAIDYSSSGWDCCRLESPGGNFWTCSLIWFVQGIYLKISFFFKYDTSKDSHFFHVCTLNVCSTPTWINETGQQYNISTFMQVLDARTAIKSALGTK